METEQIFIFRMMNGVPDVYGCGCRTCNAANCSFSSSAQKLFKLTEVPLAVVPVVLMLALLLIPLLLAVLFRMVSPRGFAVGPLHDANKLNRCLFKSFDSSVAQLSTVSAPKLKLKLIRKSNINVPFWNQYSLWLMRYGAKCTLHRPRSTDVGQLIASR